MGHIPSELKEDVLRITIDLPQKKNALTGAIDNTLADAVAPGEANPDVRVLLLDGNGDSFSAGNDLEDFVANPWKDEIDPPAIRFITSVAHASRPIVAALRRSAVGVGDDSAALRPGLCG